jgi:hypothetical protein
MNMDVGLLNRAVTQTIIHHEGDYYRNDARQQPSGAGGVDNWVAAAIFSPSAETAAPLLALKPRVCHRGGNVLCQAHHLNCVPAAPDAQTVEKSRGRLKIRELWVVAADELGPYLADEWG